jgi:hypothetical protein
VKKHDRRARRPGLFFLLVLRHRDAMMAQVPDCAPQSGTSNSNFVTQQTGDGR